MVFLMPFQRVQMQHHGDVNCSINDGFCFCFFFIQYFNFKLLNKNKDLVYVLPEMSLL